ncbi:hypothetical protein [Streptomyces sp. NPDC059161]|uniref:hypothetical protein n=1 Tax=unclassified Streptomyces TaxID=2593676 RepID=UPI0036669E6C
MRALEFCRQSEGSRTLLFFCMLTGGGLGIGGSGLLYWSRIAMSLVALAVGIFGLLGVIGWFVRLGELERERAARRRRQKGTLLKPCDAPLLWAVSS